jgi:hypothetical protein
MRTVSDRNFMNSWHIVHKATNPTQNNHRWHVADVDWQRERHRFAGGGYSFMIEVHRLDCRVAGKTSWSLLVVIEYWWDATNDEVIRSTSWGKRLSGNTQAIGKWMREQERACQSAVRQ